MPRDTPDRSRVRVITLSANTGDAGTAMSTGEVSGSEVVVPVSGTIIGWTATLRTTTGNPTGSVTLDVWRKAASGGLPSNSDSITASAKPSISAALENSATFPAWSSLIVAAGDKFVLEVESVTTAYAATLAISIEVD